LIGEDVFPATPLGEKAKLYIGHARDLTVERALAFQNNENERRDRWNKVVAYDQRTKLTYKLRNGVPIGVVTESDWSRTVVFLMES
jgi:hypothetical protein